MILPNPPDSFKKEYFQLLLEKIESLFRFVYFKDRDMIVEPNTRLILVSPNGNKYAVKVANDGTLFTELV